MFNRIYPISKRTFIELEILFDFLFGKLCKNIERIKCKSLFQFSLVCFFFQVKLNATKGTKFSVRNKIPLRKILPYDFDK